MLELFCCDYASNTPVDIIAEEYPFSPGDTCEVISDAFIGDVEPTEDESMACDTPLFCCGSAGTYIAADGEQFNDMSEGDDCGTYDEYTYGEAVTGVDEGTECPISYCCDPVSNVPEPLSPEIMYSYNPQEGDDCSNFTEPSSGQPFTGEVTIEDDTGDASRACEAKYCCPYEGGSPADVTGDAGDAADCGAVSDEYYNAAFITNKDEAEKMCKAVICEDNSCGNAPKGYCSAGYESGWTAPIEFSYELCIGTNGEFCPDGPLDAASFCDLWVNNY
jgi:hypothetical protein